MRRRQYSEYKQRAIKLRTQGKSYGDMQKAFGVRIPKSTLSLWCADIVLTASQLNQVERRIKQDGAIGLATALALQRERRRGYFSKLFHDNATLRTTVLKDTTIAKIVLATLYLGEGSKSQRSRLVFGNSNPGIIELFMTLMRLVYKVDNSKFRCTVQSRSRCVRTRTILVRDYWNPVNTVL